MSRIHQTLSAAWGKPWASTAAVAVVVGASGAFNAWAWSQATDGLARVVVVALALACEVLGACLLIRLAAAARTGSWARIALGAPLLAGVVAFNAWSGHRGFELVEAERLAPSRAIAQAEAKVTAANIALEAVAPVPLTDEAGRPIGPARTAELGAQRAAEIARLERRRAEAEAALAALPPPPPAAAMKPTDPATLCAVVVLLEAIKACGLFAVSAGPPADRRQPAQVTPLDAARALARKRWGEPKSA